MHRPDSAWQFQKEPTLLTPWSLIGQNCEKIPVILNRSIYGTLFWQLLETTTPHEYTEVNYMIISIDTEKYLGISFMIKSNSKHDSRLSTWKRGKWALPSYHKQKLTKHTFMILDFVSGFLAMITKSTGNNNKKTENLNIKI